MVWGLPGLRYQDVTTLSQALAERDQEALVLPFFFGGERAWMQNWKNVVINLKKWWSWKNTQVTPAMIWDDLGVQVVKIRNTHQNHLRSINYGFGSEWNIVKSILVNESMNMFSKEGWSLMIKSLLDIDLTFGSISRFTLKNQKLGHLRVGHGRSKLFWATQLPTNNHMQCAFLLVVHVSTPWKTHMSPENQWL